MAVQRDRIARDLAQRIRHFRIEADLSPAELADKMDLDPSAVSHWESKRSFLSILTLALFVEVCGISMATFWSWSPLPPKPTPRRSR